MKNGAGSASGGALKFFPADTSQSTPSQGPGQSVQRGHRPDFAAKKQKANQGQGPKVGGPGQVEMPAGPSAPASGGGWGAIGATGWVPPDAAVAAGPNHVVAAVNSSMAIFSKSGLKLSQFTLQSLFQGLGNGEDMVFDPRLLYDTGTGRFFFLGAARRTSGTLSWYYLAVSHTSNPLDGWFTWGLRADLNGSSPSNLWADFPALGVDAQAVYITSNQYSWSNAFAYAKLRVIGKTPLVNGSSSVSWWDFWNLTHPVTGLLADTLQPANTSGSAPAEYLVSADGIDSLSVFAITNPLASPPTIAAARLVVGSYTVPADAMQAGTTTLLDTGDDRLQSAVWRGNSLWTAHSVLAFWAGDTQNRAALRLYEIDTSAFPALSAKQTILYGGSGLYYFYPGVQVNQAGDAAVVFNRSSATDFVGLYYTGRLAGDPLHTLQSSAVLKAGQGSYVQVAGGRNRWGDYTAAALDPNATAIWMFGEYAAGGNAWGTFAGVTYGTLPLNDEETRPTVIGALPFAATEDTQLATAASGDPVHSCTGRQDSNSVWFRLTPATSGTVTVDTFGSSYDTVLTVYLASNMQELACNNDANGGQQSQAGFGALAGTSYLVEVTSFDLPGGGALKLNIGQPVVSNPVSVITTLSPSQVLSGNPGLTLTVNGSNFISGSVVRWNGSDRVTTFVSSTQLTAAITASDLATAGVFPVTVFNPSPGGGLSNALNFTVKETVPPTVTLAAPNGGEKLYIGTPFLIQWASSDNVGVVSQDVLLSANGGSTYPTVLASGLPGNATSFSWTPTVAISSARIKVVAWDASGNSGSDFSNSSFSVVSGTPSISVSSPNTAVNWGVGSIHRISWTSNLGSGSRVDLEVSRDGGLTYSGIAAGVPNTGSFNWVVSGPDTTTARIRVKWSNNTAVSDASNVNFTIAGPYLTLTTPNSATAQWGIGTQQSTGWKSNLGSLEKVRLLLSTDGGVTFPILLAGPITNDLTETVTVPNNATTTARVRVEWAANPALGDASDASFTIAAPYITLTKPNGGESFAGGSTQTFTWKSNLGSRENVKVELSTDGGGSWQAPLASTPSDGSQAVTLPAVSSSNCLARLTWLDNPAVSDSSNAAFTIGPAFITLTVPNGGEIWKVGTSNSVKWTSNIGGNVRLDLSTDGGVTWQVLVSSTANDGSTTVVAPNQPGTQARIRISSLASGFTSIQDTSDALFTIQ